MNLENYYFSGRLFRKIERFVRNYRTEERLSYRYNDCVAKFRERLELNNLPIESCAPGEEEYIRFWSQFSNRVEPYSYRYFYRLVGENPHIIPEDIADAIIEAKLNPTVYRRFYSDKNAYSQYISPHSILPKTFLCRIEGGGILAADFARPIVNGNELDWNISAKDVACFIGDYDKIVLKPSQDSHSGQGVMLFEKENGRYVSKDGQVLDGHFLREYNCNFVLQEVLKQHDFMARFCKSSVNTFRVMTYRSVEDENIYIMGSVLRIGREGSFVDNLFAGGGFVCVNVESGTLHQRVFDQYGRVGNTINNVDFSKEIIQIPFWNCIVDTAKSIARQNPHCRLLAMDLMYDIDGNVRFIESNVDGFNWSFCMYAGGIPFGGKFDEVINYCSKK